MMIYAPDPVDWTSSVPKVFLAGSIDMGASANWQEEIGNKLQDFNIILLNPRRKVWDSSWKQHIDNPLFREQVEWELEGLERADVVFFHFEKDSLAPISLLELGICAVPNKKVIVHCPNGFWRKGNVDIVCHRYGIQQVNSINEGIKELQTYL